MRPRLRRCPPRHTAQWLQRWRKLFCVGRGNFRLSGGTRMPPLLRGRHGACRMPPPLRERRCAHRAVPLLRDRSGLLLLCRRWRRSRVPMRRYRHALTKRCCRAPARLRCRDRTVRRCHASISRRRHVGTVRCRRVPMMPRCHVRMARCRYRARLCR